MKNITKVVLISFIIVLISGSKSIAQYNTPEIQGIPLISYDTSWEGWTEDDYKTMKDSAGVDILIPTNLSSANLQRLITGPGLFGIPHQIESQQNPEIKNWIYFYSEGRYTNWEAEGTNPVDGDASIYYKNNIASVFQEGSVKGIVTNDYAASDTLIYGPLYRQEVRYFVTNPGIITYQADFKLKLINTIPRQGDPLPQPTDDICRLQVTVSDIYIDEELGWVKTTIPVQDGDILLKRENFTIGNWEPKSITYNLNNLNDNFYERINNPNGETKFAQYVEFKIIWLGDPNSKLYVDNIVVSDIRGRQVRLQQFQDLIVQQDNATYIASNYADFIRAWIGRDEPESIDMFEPIRIISNVLNNHNQGARPLVMNLSVSWNGRFGDQIPWKNSNYVAKSEEFVKRTKNTHIWQNSYMFDAPFKVNGDPWWVDDYRDWNIQIFADSILSRINKVDPQFGQLILCCKFDYNLPNVSFRDITPCEFAYASNLSLLYGAKSLVLFGYFGNDNPPYDTYTGLVNWDFGAKNKTDRFYYVKNILSPRLKGLFGKTLKGLTHVKQFRSIDALYPESTTPFEFVNYIQAGGGLYDTCLIELGIFQDLNNLSAKYFMPLNRYYSNKSILTFGLRYLIGYNNWQIYDYVDTTHISVVSNNGAASFVDTIFAGDAKLYSIMPVVQNGGVLSENEFLTSDETLKYDMLIDANTELTISPDIYYTVQDTITLVDGSFITGDGYIILETCAVIQIFDWSKSVFRSAEDNHPKIIWGAYSAAEIVEGYNIYRKWNQEYFSLIGSTDQSTFQFIDEDVEIYVPVGEEPKNAEYYVTAVINVDESSEETNPSNTIDYWVDKVGKINTGGKIVEFVYELGQNYPNPFNPTTQITYGIKNNGFVTLKIYDIIGREIKTLVNDFRDAGNYNINFDASAPASGVYIYQLKAGDFISSKKMTLVK